MKRALRLLLLTIVLFGPIGLTFLEGAQISLDSWYERVNAQQSVPPPWRVSVYPDTIYVRRPYCAASFIVYVTGDYKDSPITIMVEKSPAVQSYIPGFLFDGTSNIPSRPPNYQTTVTVQVLSSCPPGKYWLKVWAYPPGRGYSEYNVYAVVNLIVEETGVSTCIATWTPPPPPPPPTATTTWTWTYTTPTRDWWDWWNWWQRFWWWLAREPFDFALDVTPNMQSVKAGQLATFTVTVRLTSGPPEPVALSLSGLPGGTSHSFSLVSGTPTFASALKVLSEVTASPGTYTLTIIGTGGGKTHSATVSLAIEKGKVDSSVSAVVSPSNLKAAQSVFASGALTPALATSVELVYTRPDGFEMAKHVSTSSSGAFSDTFKPEVAGPWSIRARWPGDANHYGCESQPASFFVEAPPEAPPLLPIAIVAIILAVAIVVVALLLKRRSGRREGVRVERVSKFCAECGTAIPKGSDYCPKCGKKTE